ncbi:UvrD-helicase domain-containing protein [Halohasta salina]|uniref:UvrD-helicase domain-containing protein n=1 Tax=Halohasta salina TaxID=2961621 RepID=UPI0020A2B24C|nr:UvrD-helicase domain-containing protein [Halohasta salina]
MSREGRSTASDGGTDLDLRLQFGDSDEPPYPPVDDQRAVLASYFDGTGRVVVDASAGTGKTSALVTTVAEAVVREASETSNPLSGMLVTTFGRDAAAELKTRLGEVLRHHADNGGELPRAVFRWLETDSTIETLDAVFGDLLREIAVEVGVPPDFDVDDRLELEELRESVFDTLREEHRSEFRTLSEAYPREDWRDYPPDSVDGMLSTAQQKCREFGITPTEAADSLRESLAVGHGGDGERWFEGWSPEAGPDSVPPETVDEITALLRAVVDEDASVEYDDDADAQQLLDHVRETYFATAEAIDAFATLLAAYEEAYDERTRRAGQFTFVDVAHLLDCYLDACEPTDPFRRTLGERFDHVFVDEFQDTSAVQCSVLRRLVDPEGGDESGDATNLLLIGDSKQAIYEWRSADPALFADIIETTKAAAPDPAPIPHLGVDDVRYHALSTVFRHHPDIAAAANHVFQRLLEDEGRGAVGDHAPSYVPVEPHGSPWDDDSAADTELDGDSDDESHLHVLDVDAASDDDLTEYIAAADWAAAEADRIGGTIAAITDPTSEPPVTVPDGEGGRRRPTPGDITLLFRSGRSIQRYAAVLREDYGIPAEAAATGDLFAQPEIELLVDVCSWLATPYAEADLYRLLRSPLVAVSDVTIRALAAADADAEALVDDWPDSLPDDDRQRLARLLSLRDDLRWMREGSKTALIHRLLQHSGLDAVLLSDSDGLRRYGNVWRFVEVVDDWEVDELLSYREFLRRLRRLRATTDSSDPQFPTAEVSDGERGDAVTLTTVHRAKGQEYPIVFLCDLPKQSTFPRLQHDRLLASRRQGFALRPRPGDPPSPAGVAFPTPDTDREQPVWFNDDFETTDYPEATGPIWLSDARTDTGELRYPNPLNAHLEAREAEFWRLAYVAFTRAENHVFLGLGSLDETSDYYDGARWSTWLAGFNETLEPSAGWDALTGNTLSREFSWRAESGNTISRLVSVGVDELPSKSPESTDGVDLGDELARLREGSDGAGYPPYRPAVVSASSLADLADCPRRFQYRHVQGVERGGVTEQPTHPAADTTRPTHTPGGLSAAEWGDVVHRLLELRLAGSDRAESHEKAQATGVREPLRRVWSAVDASRIGEQCQSTGANCVTEYELASLVSTAGRSLRVTGTVDLLYRVGGGWHLVDWKTGRRPTDGAATEHVRQLSVYAWLLDRQFGIDVETATVGYLDPTTEPVVSPVDVTADLDTEWVDRVVGAASEAVPLTTASGLEARPDPETCEGCPYAASVGGPCVDDYHAADTDSQ